MHTRTSVTLLPVFSCPYLEALHPTLLCTTNIIYQIITDHQGLFREWDGVRYRGQEKIERGNKKTGENV